MSGLLTAAVQKLWGGGAGSGSGAMSGHKNVPLCNLLDENDITTDVSADTGVEGGQDSAAFAGVQLRRRGSSADGATAVRVCLGWPV
jgi:hypothetical protein